MVQTTVWQKLWESLKEPLRYIILTGVSFVVNYVINALAGTQLSPEFIIVATLVLRGIDKFVYELQKERPEGVEGYRGITGI